MLTEVKGQDYAVRFLRRVVEGKLTSPLILVGEEGVGRRFSITQMTKEIFCEVDPKEPGCTCIDCTMMDQGNHPDFLTIAQETVDKDIGVGAIRDMIDASKNFPIRGRMRCVLIDGVDHMTGPAANAFLKTLEEPPARTNFFLLCEDYNRVLPTIRSRCGKVPYQPLPEGLVVSMLSEFEKDVAKALVYARMSESSIGRAIHYWGSGRLGLRDSVYTLLSSAREGDVATLFSTVDGIGQDLSLGLRFLDQLLHDVFIVPHDPSKLIHQDLTEGIEKLEKSVPFDTWLELSAGVRALRNQRARIVLPFHVKTLFARTLLAV